MAIATGTSLTIGYVAWLIRGGVLVSSLLTSMPAWRLLDPLPILGNVKSRGSDDDDSLESMVSADKATPAKPKALASEGSATSAASAQKERRDDAQTQCQGAHLPRPRIPRGERTARCGLRGPDSRPGRGGPRRAGHAGGIDRRKLG